MKLSIIIPVLNSHEIVRRHILHYKKIGIPDDVEIIFIDDGSDPPITGELKNLSIYRTNDTRPWTWALARNKGAKIAQGEYLLMTDLDYILSKELVESARIFDEDKMRFKREFGILNENGDFTQDIPTLLSYGLLPSRVSEKGVKMPPHSNNFCIRKDLFWEMGGYREDRIGQPYPQGEDSWFKRTWTKFLNRGMVKESEYRPTLYMFPNGHFCGNVDYNPFDLFHNLTRKTSANNWHKKLRRRPR